MFFSKAGSGARGPQPAVVELETCHCCPFLPGPFWDSQDPRVWLDQIQQPWCKRPAVGEYSRLESEAQPGRLPSDQWWSQSCHLTLPMVAPFPGQEQVSPPLYTNGKTRLKKGACDWPKLTSWPQAQHSLHHAVLYLYILAAVPRREVLVYKNSTNRWLVGTFPDSLRERKNNDAVLFFSFSSSLMPAEGLFTRGAALLWLRVPLWRGVLSRLPWRKALDAFFWKHWARDLGSPLSSSWFLLWRLASCLLLCVKNKSRPPRAW